MTRIARLIASWTLIMFLGALFGVLLVCNGQAIAQEVTQQEQKPPEQPSPQEQPSAPPSTTPAPVQPEKQEEETLQLEKPSLAPPPKEPVSLGPFSNINVGGLLDYRYIPGPRTATSGSAFLVIHVNELFISTNIGDNISILAEQLLITSGRESVVGQDHGFVYATFTNLPLISEIPTLNNLSFRIGRFRFRYGIDAVSDSAINPVRTLVYKNIGFISDRGLELSYFLGPFEVSAAVLNGPDEILLSPPAPPVRVGSGNTYRPRAIRGSLDIPSGPQIGLSFFRGNSYPVQNKRSFDPDTMIFNARLEEDTLIMKKRYSVDLKYSLWRLDFAGELTFGTDKPAIVGKDVEGYYFRTDYTVLPQKLKLLLQYDLWRDDDPSSPDDGDLSGAVTFNITEGAVIRAVGLLDLNNVETYATILQLLLSF